MNTRLSVIAVVLVAVLATATGSGAVQRENADAATVRALLMVESETQHFDRSVAIMSLAGKRLLVPALVRDFPLGLSPDARLVAGLWADSVVAVAADAVLLGPVGGDFASMKKALRGNCSPVIADPGPTCPYGVDASFAWSPDSQRLAAAANPRRGPTLLKLVDRTGHIVRSFRLPAGRPVQGARLYHELVSWSPDGSRLLLLQKDDYSHVTVVVLDIHTGRLRTLARMEDHHDWPTLAWSPNGRFLALTSEGRSPADYAYAIVDVSNARPIIQCKGVPRCRPWGRFVWAPNGSLLATVFTGGYSSFATSIVRIDLNGQRSTVVGPSRAVTLTPFLAFGGRLLYSKEVRDRNEEVVRETLSWVDLRSGRSEQLVSSRRGFDTILPLARIP